MKDIVVLEKKWDRFLLGAELDRLQSKVGLNLDKIKSCLNHRNFHKIKHSDKLLSDMIALYVHINMFTSNQIKIALAFANFHKCIQKSTNEHIQEKREASFVDKKVEQAE